MRVVPGYWCDPEVATAWLKTEGWKLSPRRARRGRHNIPAPREHEFYDLHDVACAEDVGASDVVTRIVTWSGRTDVAGNGWVQRPTESQLAAVYARDRRQRA
ncbi:MAG: hypothetical protein ACLQBL_08905 [Polyangiaceae bacterium]